MIFLQPSEFKQLSLDNLVISNEDYETLIVCSKYGKISELEKAERNLAHLQKVVTPIVRGGKVVMETYWINPNKTDVSKFQQKYRKGSFEDVNSKEHINPDKLLSSKYKKGDIVLLKLQDGTEVEGTFSKLDESNGKVKANIRTQIRDRKTGELKPKNVLRDLNEIKHKNSVNISVDPYSLVETFKEGKEDGWYMSGGCYEFAEAFGKLLEEKGLKPTYHSFGSEGEPDVHVAVGVNGKFYDASGEYKTLGDLQDNGDFYTDTKCDWTTINKQELPGYGKRDKEIEEIKKDFEKQKPVEETISKKLGGVLSVGDHVDLTIRKKDENGVVKGVPSKGVLIRKTNVGFIVMTPSGELLERTPDNVLRTKEKQHNLSESEIILLNKALKSVKVSTKEKLDIIDILERKKPTNYLQTIDKLKSEIEDNKNLQKQYYDAHIGNIKFNEIK
jgi:hypothetical protein